MKILLARGATAWFGGERCRNSHSLFAFTWTAVGLIKEQSLSRRYLTWNPANYTVVQNHRRIPITIFDS